MRTSRMTSRNHPALPSIHEYPFLEGIAEESTVNIMPDSLRKKTIYARLYSTLADSPRPFALAVQAHSLHVEMSELQLEQR